ncbi:Co2+/Mg2+ efflux protein ApaG [Aureimonas jatrophae]|jgi:ApaG protein|uniref:Protein ApaG n=1 Tax=Aureimonas jatrophae TaxID=1166073 RepID=A0A1H0L5I0_9HYPH|nr:Co2+/Mg2+ efflux protein ApaG [Aureimonas jatrophae]MBB3952418.1 ApaG protein [Aureimonas jatrophae]SDO63467.1 ApaG protein [Aureimonas jatrophae]
MYTATTRHITVSVTPTYLPEQSEPDENRWVFAYRIEIENGSRETVQLRSRYWHITDAHGHVEEVRGPGVVGEEPILSPGDSFTYTSGCPLGTSSGIMRGRFRMQGVDGTYFEIEVPAFSLDAPSDRPRTLN